MKSLGGLLVALVGVMGTVGCGAAPDDAQGTQLEVEAAQLELGSAGLTRGQAKTVLQLIDDMCGDTWCEGDHNFHFDRLECTRACGKTVGTCRLAFRMFPHDSDSTTGPTYARSCKTSGFSGFSSLVDTAANGYQSLNWQYYDALSSCINELEEQLPPL